MMMICTTCGNEMRKAKHPRLKYICDDCADRKKATKVDDGWEYLAMRAAAIQQNITNEKPEKRPDWDTFFIELAHVYSKRSTCTRLQVGCVIVKDKVPVSFGYNGSISGHEHCSDVGCLLNDEGRCIRTIHAEQNAIMHADRDKLKGATAYVTHEPCETCSKLLVQAGIKEVIFSNAYPNRYNRHFTAGVSWIHHSLT